MAPRPYWKGYLKLSLVSCPVALYPASSRSERIALHQINKRTGNRLRQQMVDEQTGDVVEKEDKGRGYEVSRDQHVPIEDEELDKISIESTHTIDIESFVPRAEIDERYMDSPYYIAPTDEVGQEAFIVIREAMREKKMVGLGRVVLYRRERILMLEPFDKGLLATALRYGYEVRDATAVFRGHSRRGAAEGNAAARLAHSRYQGGAFRSLHFRGSLRECAGRIAEDQAGRPAAAEGNGQAACRAGDQPDGRLAPQRGDGDPAARRLQPSAARPARRQRGAMRRAATRRTGTRRAG